MFDQPKYIQNILSLIFPRQIDIRRKSFVFEDRLKGDYFQPQILPVPDEFQPDAPRLIFGSLHGFSQIVVSQISIVLSVGYSPDWQIDIDKGKDYLHKKAKILFDLLRLIGQDSNSYYCGLGTRVQLPSNDIDHVILKTLSDMYLSNVDVSNLNEIQLKLGRILDNKYYSNFIINNYRSWDIIDTGQSIPRLPNNKATEHGVEIAGDFNDRFRYNENDDYRTSINEVDNIIELGIINIQGLVSTFKR